MTDMGIDVATKGPYEIILLQTRSSCYSGEYTETQ